MNTPYRTDPVLERRLSMRLIDVFIRASLILALAILCYDIFSPFVSLMAWALILAVSLYPLNAMLARRLGGRDGLAAILIVTLGLVLIVAPTTVLVMALGDSVQSFVERVGNHTLVVPEPPASVAAVAGRRHQGARAVVAGAHRPEGVAP
jgi:predicted PurR-regulated permease PerM